MNPPPETLRVTHRRIACDGTGNGLPAALGHPRVFLEIDEHGYVDCGYCDRRFILAGGPADGAEQAALPEREGLGDGCARLDAPKIHSSPGAVTPVEASSLAHR